jgi:hypothetical protein
MLWSKKGVATKGILVCEHCNHVVEYCNHVEKGVATKRKDSKYKKILIVYVVEQERGGNEG